MRVLAIAITSNSNHLSSSPAASAVGDGLAPSQPGRYPPSIFCVVAAARGSSGT